MKLLTGLHWLTSKTANQSSRSDEVDPADMGTALGLDASMADPEQHPHVPSGSTGLPHPTPGKPAGSRR